MDTVTREKWTAKELIRYSRLSSNEKSILFSSKKVAIDSVNSLTSEREIQSIPLKIVDSSGKSVTTRNCRDLLGRWPK